MAAFEDDTAVTRLADGLYEAELTDRWNIGQVPNGGYVLAVVGRALAAALPQPHPFTVTAHYVRPARPGAAQIEVELVRAGRSHATGTARLLQDGSEVVRVLATYGDLDALNGRTQLADAPPDVALPDGEPAGGRGPGPGVSIAERFHYAWPPGRPGFAHGAPTGVAELMLGLRFADAPDDAMDPIALLLVADAAPPAVFELGDVGWVPTVELTVHVRARPAPGWLRLRIASRHVQHGYLDEDVEVWDSAGALVAQSRQLAILPRRP